MNTEYKAIKVKPLGGAVGAEIYGIDLNETIPEQQFWEVRKSGGALYPQLIDKIPQEHRDQLFKEIIESISRYYDGTIINFIAGIGTAVGYKP